MDHQRAPCPERFRPAVRRGAVRAALTLAVLAFFGTGCSRTEFPGVRSGIRVLVIGLDGADWDRMDPMIREGRLPNIAGLVSGAARGRTALERPPLSPLLWTTVATGRFPDRHGILDFVERDPATGRIIPVTGRGRRVKALWNCVDDAGLESATIGWWATWPAEQVRGVMVSDRWSYSLVSLPEDLRAGGIISPPSMQAEIDAERVDPATLTAADLRRFLPLDQELRALLEGGGESGAAGVEHPLLHLRRIVAATQSVEAAASRILASRSPDLTLVYFEGIDEVGHRFARYETPALPGVSRLEARRYGGVLDAFYRYQDEVVGRLLKAAGPKTTVVLLSDHGFARGAERPLEDPADLSGRAALWHVGSGILVLAGDPFTRARLGEARLVDVAPTILAVLGLPVAEDLDGGPLMAALRDDFLAAHPVGTIASYETAGKPVRRLAAPGEAGGRDAEEQVARLRTLGYLQAGGSAASGAAAGEPTPGARLNLAAVLAAEGRLEAARTAFQEAIAADPGSIVARRGLFDLLAQSQQAADAFEAGRQLLSETSPSAESYRAVAAEWIADGRIEDGRKVLADLPPRPDAAGPLLAAGLLAQAEGRLDEAERFFRAGLEKESGSWEVAEALFRLFESEDRLGEAVPLLRHGLAARGGYSLPHLIALGYIELHEKDLAAAGDYLSRAEEIAPEATEVQLYLGSVYYRSGRFPDAARAFGRVVAADPEQRNARANQILALGRSGRIAQALQVFREAGPEGRDTPLLLNAAAFACLLNGMVREGLPLVERSLSLDPSREDTLDLAARLRQAPRSSRNQLP